MTSSLSSFSLYEFLFYNLSVVCIHALVLVDFQAKYFVDEVKDKSGKDIDVSSWKQEFVEDLPEQQNGCVCISKYYFVFSVHCSE